MSYLAILGGEIWCEAPGVTVPRVHQGKRLQGELHDVSRGPVTLPVKSSFHYTKPWAGRRQVVVAYAGTNVSRLSGADYQFVSDLGMHGTDSPPAALHCPSAPGLPEFLHKVCSRVKGKPFKPVFCVCTLEPEFCDCARTPSIASLQQSETLKTSLRIIKFYSLDILLQVIKGLGFHAFVQVL